MTNVLCPAVKRKTFVGAGWVGGCVSCILAARDLAKCAFECLQLSRRRQRWCLCGCPCRPYVSFVGSVIVIGTVGSLVCGSADQIFDVVPANVVEDSVMSNKPHSFSILPNS